MSADAARLTLAPVAGRGTVADVVAQLAGALQRGELRLGDRLPVERTLAAELGVSRTTVRRAYHRLAQAGLLEIRARQGRQSGTFVHSEVVPAELLRVPPPAVPFERIADALVARRVLEPAIAALAGTAATAEDLLDLRRILAEQQRAGDDVDRIRRLDPAFHLAIARATHNEVMVELMQTLLERLELTRDPPRDDPGEAARTIEVHRETIDAIASRDDARIRATMRDHLRILERVWEETTGGRLPPWDAPEA